jgi:transcriptional regulator with XRE-family HTH domain
MKSTKQLLGARIKEIRKSKGLSQAELSEKLEIATNFLSRIEVGANYPSLDTLEKMSEALQVDLKDFFDFEYLQEGCTDIANIEKLFNEIGEEKRKLAFKIIRAVTR